MDVAASREGSARPAPLLPTRLVMPTHARPGRRPRPSGSSRRSTGGGRVGVRRAGPSRFHASAAPLGFVPWGAPRSAAPAHVKTLWERLGDDRELAGVKVALLAALLILTAVLEWVA